MTLAVFTAADPVLALTALRGPGRGPPRTLMPAFDAGAHTISPFILPGAPRGALTTE
jgi:hypothetical protein